MEIVSSLWKFYTGKIFIFERMRETIIRMIQVFANNIVFTLEARLCSYEIAVDYLQSPFF